MTNEDESTGRFVESASFMHCLKCGFRWMTTDQPCHRCEKMRLAARVAELEAANMRLIKIENAARAWYETDHGHPDDGGLAELTAELELWRSLGYDRLVGIFAPTIEGATAKGAE